MVLSFFIKPCKLIALTRKRANESKGALCFLSTDSKVGEFSFERVSHIKYILGANQYQVNTDLLL